MVAYNKFLVALALAFAPTLAVQALSEEELIQKCEAPTTTCGDLDQILDDQAIAWRQERVKCGKFNTLFLPCRVVGAAVVVGPGPRWMMVLNDPRPRPHLISPFPLQCTALPTFFFFFLSCHHCRHRYLHCASLFFFSYYE